jgi:hypothetical protein
LNGIGRGADVHQFTMVEHRCVVADLADDVRCVSDEHDRATLALKLFDASHAFPLECFVTNREHFVDHHEFRIDVNRQRKREPRIHA